MGQLSTLPKLKIGDPVWEFDENRRVYTQGTKECSGTIIWREHWVKKKIVGESRISWLIGHGFSWEKPLKLRKNGDFIRRFYAFSEQELDERVWIHENHRRIQEHVGRLHDHALLRRIDALLKEEK